MTNYLFKHPDDGLYYLGRKLSNGYVYTILARRWRWLAVLEAWALGHAWQAVEVDTAAPVKEAAIVRLKRSESWVRYNPLTHTYDTPDGTRVAAELVDSVACMADVLHIAGIREKQRRAFALVQRPKGSP